ncbi:MAG: ABC transporter permease [Candidatus Acidiferrales bacterium]
MKFRKLILANLFRKKTRTALTVGSFAVALFLFGLLAVVRGAFSQVLGIPGADRLVVTNRVSPIPIQPLPYSYRDRILAIDGVKDVTSMVISPAYYQEDRVYFAQVAIDVENHRSLYPEFIVPDEQWQAFLADRQGCIVGEALARRFGWKVGDRVPVKGALTRFRALEFNIHGIYRGDRPEHDTSMFWYHRKLVEEIAPWYRGAAAWFIVRVTDPDRAAAVARAIDEEFANSPRETRTDTENEFGASIAKQMGNIEFLMLSVGGVVFLTLLLVTGNTMAIAVRERVGELAILKAMGFSDFLVLALVLLESLAIAGLGGALGLALAKLYTLGGDPTGGLLRGFYLPNTAIAAGFGLALLVGLLAGLLPALSAMRLQVVQALRRV